MVAEEVSDSPRSGQEDSVICERCNANVSVLVTCCVSLKVGGTEGIVRVFGLCPECAGKARPLVEQAISEVVLSK